LTKSNQRLNKRQELIGAWIKNQDEYDIVVAHLNTNLQKANNSVMNELVKTLGVWKFSLGSTQETSSEEYRFIALFIKDNFSEFTVQEIGMAMKLSISGKLESEKFYGSFSPLYISSVLNSYRQYRERVMRKAEEEAEKKKREEEKKKKATPEYQFEQMKGFINEQYEYYKIEKEIFDPFNLIYNFLRKHNLLQVPKNIIDKAMEYGKNKSIREKQEQKSLKSLISGTGDIEEETKKHARNYVIQQYFENTSIKDILGKIKIDHFKEI